MHYPNWAFAVDTSKPTIIVPGGQIIGEADAMSDVSIINVILFKE